MIDCEQQRYLEATFTCTSIAAAGVCRHSRYRCMVSDLNQEWKTHTNEKEEMNATRRGPKSNSNNVMMLKALRADHDVQRV